MAEEKVNAVTLESNQAPVTTQPSPGYGGYGAQPGMNPQQTGGYGMQTGANVPQQGGYGIQVGVNTPQQGGYGIQTGANAPQQGGYGIQAGANAPQQGGYGIHVGANVPQQDGYGIQTGGNFPQQGGYAIQAGVNPTPPGGHGLQANSQLPGEYGGGYGVQPQPGHYGPMPGSAGSHGIVPPVDNWMVRPQNVPNCPPGLEYLTTVDTLIVNQIFNAAAVVADREPENEFIIANSIGQKMYYAKEESDDCSRRLCGSRRAFRMKIFDNFGNQIVNLSRPVACQACCFPCCLQKMEVSAPPGTTVGLIDQEWAFLHPTFAIKGPTGDVILRIQGPWCTMNCYADVDFKVLTADGANEVGKISKRWSGYANENSAKMDVFGISFPMDLDVRMKAVMLGACFLIDMMYFEQNVTNPNKSPARQQQELKPV